MIDELIEKLHHKSNELTEMENQHDIVTSKAEEYERVLEDKIRQIKELKINLNNAYARISEIERLKEEDDQTIEILNGRINQIEEIKRVDL